MSNTGWVMFILLAGWGATIAWLMYALGLLDKERLAFLEERTYSRLLRLLLNEAYGQLDDCQKGLDDD